MKVPSWIKPVIVSFTFFLFGGGCFIRLTNNLGDISIRSFVISLLIGIVTGLLGSYLIDISSGKVAPPKQKRSYGILNYTWDTIFRLFPHPEALGLYPIGNPSDTSPIIATGNFRLTVKRVQDAIDFDCWLLICNSRGINVWCSSLAGHFGTVDVIKAIKDTHLADVTRSRRLILPQLCAANVFFDEIQAKTGFHAEFGPVYVKNLDAYLENPKTEGIRSVAFKAVQRIEMAIGSPIILSVVLLAIYNFFDLAPLLYVIPILYLLSVIHGLIFPYKFIKDTNLWAVFCGLVVFTLVYWFLPLGSALAVSIGMAYLTTEFTGWSPLIKYAIGKKPGTVEVNTERCIGCGKCMQVCPRNVFEIRDKAIPVRKQSCEMCLSCIRQCPEKAISKVPNRLI